MKRNLLVVCGPTATGKTKLGIYLAKKFGGEIVSADSRQVYKGMDIGTGKDLFPKSKIKDQRLKIQSKNKKFNIGYYLADKVSVWLYDVVEPNFRFSVADYLGCARRVIEDIWRRGGLPVLVGGAGFYIKAVIDGIGTLGVLPDWSLRWRLRDKSAEELFSFLNSLDWKRAALMNSSDRANPRRLMRAIEIVSKIKNEKLKMKNCNLKFEIDKALLIGLRAPTKILYQRIDQRVDKRVKQGIEKEIRQLLEKGYDWENSAVGETLGYREWEVIFKGSEVQRFKGSRKEVIQRWKYNEHAYARRQLTWFKKDKRIKWFDIDKKGWQQKTEELVGDWFGSN